MELAGSAEELIARDDEGENKVLSLEEAIRTYVRPRMQLHIETSSRAAICELLRQYRGRNPAFTLIMLQLGGMGADLLHCGLVRKLIGSAYLNSYPRAGPIPALQRAYKDGTVDLESWSLYALIQRLMAGALGLPFMPTRSMVGSSMAEEASSSLATVPDPFGNGNKAAVVKALNPDLSIVHASAADASGNVIMLPPFEDGLWGAKASRGGVIVTVEKLVSTEFIRSHSYLVKLPGYMVRAVCVVPFGRHPGRLDNLGLPELETYGQDDEFLRGYGAATDNAGDHEKWLQEWVFGVKDQAALLEKLGADRLAALRDKAVRERASQDGPGAVAAPAAVAEGYSSTEMMVIGAARKIANIVEEHGYKLIQVGAGTGALACSMAYYLLKQRGYNVELVSGIGAYGLNPRRVRTGVFGAKLLSDVTEAYGVFVGGQSNTCLTILGTGQIDKHGNTNTSKISADLLLTGSGGANDAASLSTEVLVMTRQSARRFVDHVPYVTCPGTRIKTVVSDMGVLEKDLGPGELRITEVFPRRGVEEPALVEQMAENCGWPVAVDAGVSHAAAPSQFELDLLRALDPERIFLQSD